jgi:hypothetical protein
MENRRLIPVKHDTLQKKLVRFIDTMIPRHLAVRFPYLLGSDERYDTSV